VKVLDSRSIGYWKVEPMVKGAVEKVFLTAKHAKDYAKYAKT
jgi:hypothetical protein